MQGLRDMYCRTRVSVELPASGWVTAGDAVAVLGAPFHVLTAWNPGDGRPGMDANRQRNSELADRIVTLGGTLYPALGASPDDDHFEESYAVIGLERSVALKVGREFAQEAIFEVTPSTQRVLACDGTWEESRLHTPE